MDDRRVRLLDLHVWVADLQIGMWNLQRIAHKSTVCAYVLPPSLCPFCRHDVHDYQQISWSVAKLLEGVIDMIASGKTSRELLCKHVEDVEGVISTYLRKLPDDGDNYVELENWVEYCIAKLETLKNKVRR